MFEMNINIVNPMKHEKNLDVVLLTFLSSIGYMPRIDPQRDFEMAIKSVPYLLFKECFLERGERWWSIEELLAYLHTTRPTLYRHLNKLKSLDLLEEKQEGMNKKYRLRYGDIAKAWTFVEANVNLAMQNYRIMVEHISSLVRR
ncbi:MAG: helix-turn-helix transcriptional regulator [Thermoplasmata archaeon]|nr:helix-turn-helix transcriptional regulator [Thermoplasmata archaeon]